MKKNRSWETSLVGIFGMLVLLGSGYLIYTGKATYTEVGTSLGFITAFLVGILGILAKSANKTGLPK